MRKPFRHVRFGRWDIGWKFGHFRTGAHRTRLGKLDRPWHPSGSFALPFVVVNYMRRWKPSR